MVIIATLPALFAVLGLVIWFVAKNPKVSEMGKLMFFAGLWVFLMLSNGKSIKF